jgi:phosphoribosylaminoimidazolecarboxamide formyltransferase/IMP cyclohydrolase
MTRRSQATQNNQGSGVDVADPELREAARHAVAAMAGIGYALRQEEEQMPEGSVKVKRALISTYDRSGLIEFAGALQELGVELVSTGGTGRALREADLAVTEVADVTGFPEIMDGRVKTLHPKIHGGLLAVRDNAAHMATLEQHGIAPFELVCVNLYPFEAAISKPGCSLSEAIENIDIGGPAMLRSSSKNNRSIYVVSSPAQYPETIERLRADGGHIDATYGLRLAIEVYRLTSRYDGAITAYLAAQTGLPS